MLLSDQMKRWRLLQILSMLDPIEIAAKELVHLYGDRAIERAKERVESLEHTDDLTELDRALMILSAIEKMGG